MNLTLHANQKRTSPEINRLFKGKNRQLAIDLIGIVDSLRDYWPLTVRQVYYQAVAGLLIPNCQNRYKGVSEMLTTLRRNDLMPWDAIEDRTRRTIDKRGISDMQAFVAGQVESFLDWRYYHRCYVQHQPVYCEVATEKDALSKIVEEAVWIFCTRVNIVRGQVSSTMANRMAECFEKAVYLGQKPVLVYLGDLDPSGVAIPKALIRNMREHHGVDVELRRIALNPEQVEQYRLPVSIDAAKQTDNNYGAWLREYGKHQPAVELDALHPKELTELITEALTLVYDMTDISEQQRIEALERATLKTVRRDVMNYCRTRYPDVFAGVQP